MEALRKTGSVCREVQQVASGLLICSHVFTCCDSLFGWHSRKRHLTFIILLSTHSKEQSVLRKMVIWGCSWLVYHEISLNTQSWYPSELALSNVQEIRWPWVDQVPQNINALLGSVRRTDGLMQVNQQLTIPRSEMWKEHYGYLFSQRLTDKLWSSGPD